MTTIRSTELDFDTIKESLKTYLQQQSEFADYDFDASGLSNILDVLAYNTHANGLIANLGINESFLSTAQLRSSVVSHAENLGYYPRSKTGAFASVQLSVNTTSSTPTVTLPANTEFTGEVDDVTYTFQTLEDYIGTNNGSGAFTFATAAGSTSIPIYEGTLKTKTFIVGSVENEQVYVIPDETIDTATMTVNVYETPTSESATAYLNINDVARIDTTSNVFIVRETPNGYYELVFSDGNVLGQAPTAGNKIIVTYLSTRGPNANAASTFIPSSQITIDSTAYDIAVTTVANSAGGSEKESIDSIKLNAPLAYASQQRLVTADDYKALILQNYSSTVDAVSAWGGNDNVPPVYGRVYASLKFKDGLTDAVKTTVKNSIVSSLSENLAIMSIDTVFTDPVTTFVEAQTYFNFDPALSGNTVETIQNSVLSTVNTYFENNLNTFDAVFRRSNLLSLVDDISPAILNSRMNVKVQRRLVPTLNFLRDYSLDFPVALATPDDVNYTVTSSRFTYSGETCTIRNQLTSNRLQIVNQTGEVLQDNVGTYNASNGTIDLRAFTLTAYEGSSIKFSATPANQSTIRPLRNYILNIDSTLSFARGTIDYQTTAVSL